MPTNYAATHRIILGGSDDGVTFTWTSTSSSASAFNVIDQNDDNDLDIDLDNYIGTFNDFSGFYYTASNGNTYAIFQNDSIGSDYYIPYNAAEFDLAADIASSGSLTDRSDNFVPTGFHVCFCAGSLIATPRGEVVVEALSIGDVLRGQNNTVVKVKWIGRQTVNKFRSGSHTQPVRIRAGALGHGLPHADLTVTADHGMVIDGYVINASALVNGDTIEFVPMDELADSFTVYHVETENHDVILANGAPAETFVDAVTRSHFDNYQEYIDLYGVERIIPEMDRPRITSRRLLPQMVKDRLRIGSHRRLGHRIA